VRAAGPFGYVETPKAARIPWPWHDVVARLPAPCWAPSLVLLAVLLAGGLAVAAVSGQAGEAAEEPRFWLVRAFPASCSLAIALAPGTIERRLTSLRAWIEHAEHEPAAMRREMARDLVRFSPLGAANFLLRARLN